MVLVVGKYFLAEVLASPVSMEDGSHVETVSLFEFHEPSFYRIYCNHRKTPPFCIPGARLTNTPVIAP
jgi:hypothetical protein